MTALEIDETQVVVDILTTGLTPARVVTELPADLETQVPLVRVFRIGGADDGYVLDQPLFAVHAFAKSQADSDALCRQAGTMLRAARGVVTDGGVITRVRKTGGPTWAAVDNQQLRHSVSLYRVYVKAA